MHFNQALTVGAWPPMTMPLLLQWTAGAFVVSAILFVGFQDLDIAAASFFFASGQFIGRLPSVEIVREFLKLVYIFAVIAAIVAVARGYSLRRDILQLSPGKWIVVLATLIIGPGLVANVLLKDQIGRARPHQTELFGGSKAFTPALVLTNQCDDNCSFVSGEASSMFALFFGLAVVAGPRARAFITLGIAMGGLAGLIRMSQGAHFLSDVVFAGIFMAMTAILMRALIMHPVLPDDDLSMVPGWELR